MTKIPFSFFFLLTTLLSSSSSDADQRLHSRHLLHQPFFPVISAAPPPYQPPSSSTEPPSPSPHAHHHHKKHPATTQPPPPPPHEKHLFSSVATPPLSPPHPNSFFPSSDPSSTVTHPPPPPPPPSSLLTFPANISSLLFPTHNTNPKPHKNRHIAKLITITASVISAASLLSLFAVFVIFLRRTRHRQRRRSSPAFDTKSTRSDSLQLFNGAPSDKQPPKYASSHTSSEFLYLGTLVNSRSTGLDNQKSPVNVTGVLELPAPPASSSSSSSYSQYHKLGSPELRPLPPLPKLPTFTPINKSSEQLNPKRHDFDGDDHENDEFYSPRGSSGRKQSLKDSDEFGPTNYVSSLNGSPVMSLRPKSVSPRHDDVSSRPVPTRPAPPPPPQPRLSEIPASVSISPEKEEESLKPKLKALHWDKVRASSSRVMVWDQIKGNSFQ